MTETEPGTNAAPPSTPCRDSTVTTSHSDRSASIAGSARTCTPSQLEFQPYQALMRTPITIEYGPDLASTKIMHEELLRCHSTTYEKYYAQAERRREVFAQAVALKKRLTPFVYPEVTKESFKEGKLESKARALVVEACETYPIKSPREGFHDAVTKALSEQIVLKNLTPDPAPKLGPRAKDSRDMSSKVGLAQRMGFLDAHGVYGVTADLYAKVHRLVSNYRTCAKGDPIMATAQRRLLLPNADEMAIESLSRWTYRESYYSPDAAHTYAVLELATNLGVVALAERCLAQLANEFTEVVDHANIHGIALHTLIGSEGQDVTNTIDVVVDKVFKSPNPPPRLLYLVMNTLADNLDEDLWLQVRNMTGHKEALKLIDVLVTRRLVKIEPLPTSNVKSEEEIGVLASFKHKIEDHVHSG